MDKMKNSRYLFDLLQSSMKSTIEWEQQTTKDLDSSYALNKYELHNTGLHPYDSVLN
jgi:hypothetical protein